MFLHLRTVYLLIMLTKYSSLAVPIFNSARSVMLMTCGAQCVLMYGACAIVGIIYFTTALSLSVGTTISSDPHICIDGIAAYMELCVHL